MWRRGGAREHLRDEVVHGTPMPLAAANDTLRGEPNPASITTSLSPLGVPYLNAPCPARRCGPRKRRMSPSIASRGGSGSSGRADEFRREFGRRPHAGCTVDVHERPTWLQHSMDVRRQPGRAPSNETTVRTSLRETYQAGGQFFGAHASPTCVTNAALTCESRRFRDHPVIGVDADDIAEQMRDD